MQNVLICLGASTHPALPHVLLSGFLLLDEFVLQVYTNGTDFSKEILVNPLDFYNVLFH